MDPQHEQRLRDEVIYLHFLWHQGPPRLTTTRSLQPSNNCDFKKEKRPKRQRRKKSTKKPNIASDDPGKDWDCFIMPSTEAPSTWANLGDRPALSTRLPISKESPKFAAKQAQQKALKTVREFFISDDAEGGLNSMYSSSDEDDGFTEEDEYTFFLKMLMEDEEMQEWFKNNFLKGEFVCLICGALGGKNSGKKFKGCLSLVQHSITISKTKKRRAHRAYGRAVCKVLGWDIDRLPSIVSKLSNSETQTSFKSDNKEGDANIAP